MMVRISEMIHEQEREIDWVMRSIVEMGISEEQRLGEVWGRNTEEI